MSVDVGGIKVVVLGSVFKAQKLIILTHKYYLYMWGDYNDITIFSLT
jgi:hypothetical protein